MMAAANEDNSPLLVTNLQDYAIQKEIDFQYYQG